MRKLLRGLFWMVVFVITVLSLLPAEHLTLPIFDWWDKAQHALAFLVLGTIGLRAYPGTPFRLTFGLLVFGLAIEIAQTATGWRYGDWKDWVADAVGAGAAYVAWVFLTRAQRTGQISVP